MQIDNKTIEDVARDGKNYDMIEQLRIYRWKIFKSLLNFNRITKKFELPFKPIEKDHSFDHLLNEVFVSSMCCFF